MKTNTARHETPLDPRRFTETIRRQPEFIDQLPTDVSVADLSPEKRRLYIGRAIASSALTISQKLEKDRGEYDLDANLYKLVAELNPFFEGQQTLDELREGYDSPRDMPLPQRQLFRKSKQDVIGFNHTLHEVINAGASRFGFNDLLTFMTTMYTRANGPEQARQFHDVARTSLIGMRNEMAFEQLLIAGDIEYELGSAEQDAAGGDFIINDTLLDVKASEIQAEKARQKAHQEGRDPSRIIWSHIEFEDYEGKLTLPYNKIEKILARLQPDLQQATRT